MKHNLVLAERQYIIIFIFVFIALLNLVSAAYFKAKAETMFLSLEQDFNNFRYHKSDETLHAKLHPFLYFHGSLQEKFSYLRALSEKTTEQETQKEFEVLLNEFVDAIHQEEKRLRFGYDSLIYVSFILMLFSLAVFLIFQAEQRTQYAEQNARNEEQKRLSFDLHDGLAQYLIAAKLQLEQNNTELAQKIMHTAVQEVRWLCGILHYDLNKSFEHLARESAQAFNEVYNIPVTIIAVSARINAMSQTTKAHLVRILQEALSNAAKHSNATKIHIKLADTIEGFRFVIQDNGIGCNVDTITKKNRNKRTEKIGFRSIQDRCTKLDASLEIKSELGLTLAVLIPWESF